MCLGKKCQYIVDNFAKMKNLWKNNMDWTERGQRSEVMNIWVIFKSFCTLDTILNMYIFVLFFNCHIPKLYRRGFGPQEVKTIQIEFIF